MINVKRNVGFVRDHDKTMVPHSEHKREVREDDDDLSDTSNDKSICPNRTEGVTVDNNSKSD